MSACPVDELESSVFGTALRVRREPEQHLPVYL